MALAPTEPPIPRHIVITHVHDTVELSHSEEKDDSGAGRPPRLPRQLAKNLPLVDEIDLRDCLVAPAAPWRAAAIQGTVIGKERLEVLCTRDGSGDGEGYRACPCCRRYIRQEDANAPSHDSKEDELQESKEAESLSGDSHTALATLWSALTMQSSLAAPPLVAGDEVQRYTVTETIVQGWLYKKGSGDDWAGRRWWKPRWVTLALATSTADPAAVPAPCLIAHRAPGVPYPASVLELTQSAVVMAIERTNDATAGNVSDGEPEEEEWNRHCFQIVENRSHQGRATARVRMFTAPLAERNEWVFALNNALLAYEKRMGRARLAGKSSPANTDATTLSYGVPKEERRRPRGRTRSPSPVRRWRAAGLPPTSPRRGVRSPSPVRSGAVHPVEALASPATP